MVPELYIKMSSAMQHERKLHVHWRYTHIQVTHVSVSGTEVSGPRAVLGRGGVPAAVSGPGRLLRPGTTSNFCWIIFVQSKYFTNE